MPKIGSAEVTVSISDADGFRVTHKDGSELVHIPSDHVQKEDWTFFWSAIKSIEATSTKRKLKAALREKGSFMKNRKTKIIGNLIGGCVLHIAGAVGVSLIVSEAWQSFNAAAQPVISALN